MTVCIEVSSTGPYIRMVLIHSQRKRGVETFVNNSQKKKIKSIRPPPDRYKVMIKLNVKRLLIEFFILFLTVGLRDSIVNTNSKMIYNRNTEPRKRKRSRG